MKRIILFTFLGLLIAQATWAKLRVTKEPDGTVVLTLEATGDIANEFTNIGYAKYKASSAIQPYLNATKLKIKTASGVKMSGDDLKRISGMAEEENNFPNVNTLDLENADLQSDYDLAYLHFMDNLKTITFPRTTTQIPSMCLTNASCKIEHVIIPDNDKRDITIKTQAFGPTLITAQLGEVKAGGNSTIEGQAFLNCTNLTTVDFGYGWKTIGMQAFYGCTALKDITLPEGVETIGFGAFSGSAIEAIRLPNTLKRIEATAFNCHYLKSITIPASVEYIAGQAFQENHALTDVYVLGENTKAGNQAFAPADVSSFIYKPGATITRDNYTKDSRAPLTMLHYPAAAKNKYVNYHSRTEGGSTHSVRTADGNIWPTVEDGKYTYATGDYAGWNNFAISTPIKSEEVWEDDKRVGDKWYTLCLPFDMTAQQLKSAYGSKVEVVEFSDVTGRTEMTPKGEDKYITFKFKDRVTETKAHHPYMIHPAIHKRTLTGVKNTIVGIKKQPENDASLQTVVKTWDGVTYTFRGNYTDGKMLQPYSYYYYSGDDETTWPNAFYKWGANEGGKWTKYTACILASKDDHARAKAFTAYGLTELDDVTNGISGLNAIQPAEDKIAADGKVYNLNGQVVRASTDSLSTLPKGIYIVNGKKYSVR